MIYVTMGTLDYNFDRLINALERLPDVQKSQILAQIGGNRSPMGVTSFKFCSRSESMIHISEAEVLITHGGSTLMEGLIAGKRIVAVPRLKKFGEALNDHQLDLCKKLGENGSIICVEDIDELEAGISKAMSMKVNKGVTGPLPDELLNILRGMVP